MTGKLQASKQNFRLAWTIFIFAVSTWFLLRGAFRLSAAFDVLIVIALAAQAWLLFLPADKCQ